MQRKSGYSSNFCSGRNDREEPGRRGTRLPASAATSGNCPDAFARSDRHGDAGETSAMGHEQACDAYSIENQNITARRIGCELSKVFSNSFESSRVKLWPSFRQQVYGLVRFNRRD